LRVKIHSEDGEEIDITGMTIGLIDASVDTDRFVGLYNKYTVRYKADADADVELGHCDLFILDLCHDPFSFATLTEYIRDDGGEIDLNKQPYVVERIIDPNGKHKDCDYFVLNLTTEERARKAAAKYVDLCREKYPALAHELSEKILRNTLQKENSDGEGKIGWGLTQVQQAQQTPLDERSEGSPASEAPE